MKSKDTARIVFKGPDDNHKYHSRHFVDGIGHDDAIHLEGPIRMVAVGCEEATGGSEAVVDIKEGINVRIRIEKWFPLGRWAATIGSAAKEKVSQWRIGGCLHGHGKDCDVEIRGGAHHGVLALTSSDGKPVRVRVLDAQFPLHATGSGPYKYIFPSKDWGAWHRGIAWLYLLCREIREKICK